MADKKSTPENPDRRKFLKTASLVPAGMYLQAGTTAEALSAQAAVAQPFSGYSQALTVSTLRPYAIPMRRQSTRHAH